MEDSTTEDSYEAAKKKAKGLYSKIGRVWCPALNDYVVFNSEGFRHLIWKEGKHRFKSEQKRRFALISCAEEILKNENANLSYRETNNAVRVRFWAFTEKRDDKAIKLIVRQQDGGRKHFLSIFETNKKPTRK